MSNDTPSESITALLAYSQADEEGIIVTVSRQAIHEVVRENARLREELAIQSNANVGLMEELAEAKREYQDACKLVAQMHHAAIGSIQGPIRGVVEDVADVVETHRMQIAAISTACLMNSRNSEPPITKEHPYWSPAYEDAVQAVGREMNQRERAEQAEARALANEKDAGRLNAMSEHEWRIGWNREGDLCRVWAEDMEGNRDPVCGWDKFFPDHRAAIDAAIGAKHD